MQEISAACGQAITPQHPLQRHLRPLHILHDLSRHSGILHAYPQGPRFSYTLKRRACACTALNTEWKVSPSKNQCF